MEWDNGIRGNFNLQMFQHFGRRQICIWGEEGYVEFNTWPEDSIRVVSSNTGEIIEHRFAPAKSGHGGSDGKMIGRFVEAIESSGKRGARDETSGLSAGLAATLVAERADRWQGHLDCRYSSASVSQRQLW